MLAKGSTAIDGLSGSGRRRQVALRGPARLVRDAVDAHRPGDVLERLLAEVLEGEIELACGVLVHPRRDADAARLGQAFEPRRDIDAVAKDVAVLDDDVAEIDADAELDAACPAGAAVLRSVIAVCTSTAQRTASTTLANSTRARRRWS